MSRAADFYCFNTAIAGIEEADALLIIGANPRSEAPVLNARIRKAWLHNGMPIGLIGTDTDLTYSVVPLGASPSVLTDLHAGTHDFAKVLAAAKKPMIIVGQGALARPDGSAVLAAAWRLAAQVGALAADWHGFNVLHTAAGRVGALDLGFVPGPNGKGLDAMLAGGVDLLWLLAPTSSTRPASVPGRSSSTRAITATPAPSAPTSSCPAPPTPRNPAPMSTPRAGSSAASRRSTRPARRGRTGRSCAPSARRSASLCPTTRSRRCARAWSRLNPVFGRVGCLARFGCTDHTGPARRSGRAERRGLCLRRAELLPDRSDQPIQPDHGGVRRCAVDAGPRRSDGGGVARCPTSSSTPISAW